MTYYRDLDRCTYFGLENDDAVVAVGWLEPGNDFPRGSVDKKFFDRLEELCIWPWESRMYLGGHQCELCQHRGPMLTSNLFIPYEGRVFAAPAGITHYIRAHWYRPPDVFISAVAQCPDMGTAEYGAALISNGGSELAQGFEPYWDEIIKTKVPPPEACEMAGCYCVTHGCMLRNTE